MKPNANAALTGLDFIQELKLAIIDVSLFIL